MRRATFTDGTSGCSASALTRKLARARERRVDRHALDLLDRLDERARVTGHVADRERAAPGAADHARNLDDRVGVEERQAAPVRGVEDLHAAARRPRSPRRPRAPRPRSRRRPPSPRAAATPAAACASAKYVSSRSRRVRPPRLERGLGRAPVLAVESRLLPEEELAARLEPRAQRADGVGGEVVEEEVLVRDHPERRAATRRRRDGPPRTTRAARRPRGGSGSRSRSPSCTLRSQPRWFSPK